MKPEELEELKKDFKKKFDESPRKVLEILEKMGAPMKELTKKSDVGRGLTKLFSKDMTDDDIVAVEFVFWMAYLSERLISERSPYLK